jgi:hypothetical protein
MIKMSGLSLKYSDIIENSTQQPDWLNTNVKYLPLLYTVISERPDCLLLNIGSHDVKLVDFDTRKKILNNSEKMLLFVLTNEINTILNKSQLKYSELNELFFNILIRLENSPVRRTDMYNSCVNYYQELVTIYYSQKYNHR